MSPDVVVRRSSAGRTFLALLAGLVLGAALTVGALASGLLAVGDTGADDPLAAETPEPTADPGSATTAPTGDVPPSCLAAAQYNATVSASLDDVAIGVRDQDALAVEQGLDAIAKIKPDMDAQSEECRALAGDDGATS